MEVQCIHKHCIDSHICCTCFAGVFDAQLVGCAVDSPCQHETTMLGYGSYTSEAIQISVSLMIDYVCNFLSCNTSILAYCIHTIFLCMDSPNHPPTHTHTHTHACMHACTHTHTHTHMINFKKPGTRWPVVGARLV